MITKELKEGFKKISKKITKKVKKPKIVEEVMSEQDIEKLPKKVESNRALLQGKLAASEEKYDELQKELSPSIERQEIARFLKKQKEQLYWKEFHGSLSLKELFKHISSKGKIGLLSYNQKKSFGLLEDIAIRPDGRFTIIVKKNGVSKPLCVGVNASDLFWDYEGLGNSASMGFFLLSMNEYGTHVKNFLSKEIPRIIIDKNGKYHTSKFSKEKFMSLIVEKDILINELMSQLEMAHETLGKIGYELNLTKINAKLNRSRRQTAEAILSSEYKQSSEIMKNFREMGAELSVKAQQEFIKNKKIANLEDVRDEIMTKLKEIESSTPVDKAKEKLESTADFIVSLLQAETHFTKKPESEEEIEKTQLTKKFEKVKI